jgi:mRNA interferase MazF
MGVRPCVLIGVTPVNDARRTVLVLLLSSSGTPRPPLAIEVECLGRNVVAVCDKSRLHQKAGSLKPDDLERIIKEIISKAT